MSKKVYIICGPTSSGKTSLAIKICKDFNGEIISADSRQLYKYMDIGTGKIPVNTNLNIQKNDKFWLVDGVKIWGYDLAEPNDYFSAVDFAVFAREKTDDVLAEDTNVFVVGGTGFYIDVYTGEVKTDNTKPDLDLRNELESKNLEQLQKQLMSLNTYEYKLVDKKNKVRLIRSIEKEIGSEKNSIVFPYPTYDFKYIGLTGSRELLYTKSDVWVETIWKNGLVEETKKLIELGFENSRKLQGLVYKSVISFIKNEMDEENVIERIKYDIHAYIRRQQTYFKRNKNIKWFDINTDDLYENVYNLING